MNECECEAALTLRNRWVWRKRLRRLLGRLWGSRFRCRALVRALAHRFLKVWEARGRQSNQVLGGACCAVLATFGGCDVAGLVGGLLLMSSREVGEKE